MPVFPPGIEKTAIIGISNPQPLDLKCDIALYLGTIKGAEILGVDMPANSRIEEHSPVVMPGEPRTYPIRLFACGKEIPVEAEDVEIVAPTELATIIDPKIGLVSYPRWSTYSIPGDFIAGAELSISFRVQLIEPNREHYLYEFYLTKDSEIIPIGLQDSVAWTSTWVSWVPEFIATLPNIAGSYDTMLRIYRNGVLAAQYPYLGTITVLPKGVSHFSYSKPTILVYWDSSWPAYRVRTSCTITNLGSSYEKRKVSLWRLKEYADEDQTACSYFYKVDDEWRCLRPRPRGEIILGLNPGQSYNYYYDDLVYASHPEKVCVQLRDEDGNVSAKSNMITIPL